MKKLKKIYLIDDDEGINFLNRAIITRLKMAESIESFKDPLEAFTSLENALAAGEAPELILLDINMPLLDGWQFVDRYASLDRKKRSVIIMLSSSIDPADESRAASIPEISAFRSKPLSFDMAEEIVERFF